ncbi:ScbA/BarX family gamma-butyrolactone biosynthesis protein [Streptomyces sp. NPDC019224]|uniref:ScbA/BarX family gamma-butyrolactone biosynthesis protein n=1 Tax=Streptomyces sp. NPDC019224 TaxID=3154484 RepID=UPI0033E9FF4F
MLDFDLTAFTTTVPRQYVHRAAISEVLLTGWRPAQEPHTFVVGTQWPRGHALFAQSGGYQDPMLFAESVRQVGALLAHAEYGVEFGDQFLMGSMHFAAPAPLFVATPAPTEVELHVACHDIVQRGKRFAGMRYEVTAVVEGESLGSAGATMTCIRPSVYGRLRGGRSTHCDRLPGLPIDPALVGRTDARHVVLSEISRGAGDRWELRVDCGHPIFFDHPVDHVPGMVLLEAARQAAHAVTGMPDTLVVALDSTFERYAELDAPCLVEAEPTGVDAAGDVQVRVRGQQEGEAVFEAYVTLRTRTH